VEVGRVFTAIAISPSEGLRQLSARYAFRAGRNLPDKELRSNVNSNSHWRSDYILLEKISSPSV